MVTKKNLKPEANLKKTAAPISGRDAKKTKLTQKTAANPAEKAPPKTRASAVKSIDEKPAAPAPKAAKEPAVKTKNDKTTAVEKKADTKQIKQIKPETLTNKEPEIKKTKTKTKKSEINKAEINKAEIKKSVTKNSEVKKIKIKKSETKTTDTDIEESKERIGVKKNLTTKKNSSDPAVKAENIASPAVRTAKKNTKPAAAASAKVSKKPAVKISEKNATKSAAREIKKVVVKTPQTKPEVMSVTSADVENLYGKHYIINTAQELPETYGKNRLITLVRDPEWIYTFWDVATETIAEIRKTMGPQEFDAAKRILRVYDGHGAGAAYSDIELTDTASSWYIHVKPDAAYILELGYRSRNGEFYKIAASNDVATPPAGVSAEGDEKWMVKDGVFEKIYELSGGSQLGMSSADIMQAMARGMKPEEFSKLITSGVSSETLSSQFAAESARKEQEIKKQRKFWMVLNTELIVYGATEPDASVTIMGKPIKLRPDGTFSIRMALPDTDIDIPAVGVSADKVDEITITPEVHKRTHYSRKEKELAI